MSSPRFRIPRFSLVVLLSLAMSFPLLADSHVRIVRLSYMDGSVLVSRSDSKDYQKAMVNLPIVEGMKLKTEDDGRAEIEFEDGSTLRIVPGSAVEFTTLSLRDSGIKASDINVSAGTVYVTFAGSKDAEFSLSVGGGKVSLSQAAHLRIDYGNPLSSIALFKGGAQVDGPSGTVELKKNQTLTFEISGSAQYQLAKNIHREPWDEWDDQQNEYHTRYAMKSNNNYSPYAYGMTDLSYYGSFFDYPSYGMLWQPYFVGVGWDPFMDGAWTYFPGWGFGWVSAYPWGWTPYHSGSWVFIPGRGWAWQPGGVWQPVYTQPVVVNAPKTFVPPRPPVSGTRTLVVNRGPASVFSGEKLVVRNNSAGLGVPRGDIRNLGKMSQKVETRGSVSQRISTPSVAMTGTGTGMGRGPAGTNAASRGSAAHSGAGGSGLSSHSAPSMPSSHSAPAPSMPSSHAGGAPAGGPAHR
ncbi:MAG TPA: FecR family protein [Terriglobales bacterium]|nr:FecR family protein [Terriglobales bacterium]